MRRAIVKFKTGTYISSILVENENDVGEVLEKLGLTNDDIETIQCVFKKEPLIHLSDYDGILQYYKYLLNYSNSVVFTKDKIRSHLRPLISNYVKNKIKKQLQVESFVEKELVTFEIEVGNKSNKLTNKIKEALHEFNDENR